MKIAVVAPSPVPYRTGGAERLWDALVANLRESGHAAELLKIPCKEYVLSDLLGSYCDFAELDLAHFDSVITGKYPAWAVNHPDHVVWMLHPLRGLYDRYPAHLATETPKRIDPDLGAALRLAARLHSVVGPLGPALQEIRGHVQQAQRRLGTDHPDLTIPSPAARSIIRCIDHAALSPTRIRTHAAISGDVTRRDGWFPVGAHVAVVCPPLSIPITTPIVSHPASNRPTPPTDRPINESPEAEGEALPAHSDPDVVDPGAIPRFLVVGRLETPKRIDWAIQAIAMAAERTKTPLALDIVGNGPMRERLESLASEVASRGDIPVEIAFHGAIDDAELVAKYQACTATIFTPDREDFGFVALESMSYGRPVITASDSGGPLELVENGVNGWIVTPDPPAIAEAIAHAATEPIRTRAFGEQCVIRAAAINWPDAINDLLTPSRRPGTDSKTIVALSTYPIYPRAQGGPLRAWHLLRGLTDAGFEVEIISFTVDRTAAGRRTLADGVRETTVLISPEQSDAETRMRLVSGPTSITDIACSLLWPATPDFAREALHVLDGCVGVVLIQPFLAFALDRLLGDEHRPILLDAHNLESTLKSNVLAHNEGGRWLAERARQAEAFAVEIADIITPTTEDDRIEIERRYNVDPAKMVVVANGTDVETIPFVGLADRPALRRDFLREIGAGGYRDMAIFVGSGHQPNIEAGKQLVKVAKLMPNVAFVLIGRHSELLPKRSMPANVFTLGIAPSGIVDAALAAASVGVNPIASGGGSNLKLTAYFAAGTPVVTTPTGARGIPDPSSCAVISGERPDQLAAGISAVLADSEGAERRAQAARRFVEAELDWRILGARFGATMERLVGSTADAPRS